MEQVNVTSAEQAFAEPLPMIISVPTAVSSVLRFSRQIAVARVLVSSGLVPRGSQQTAR